MQRQEQFTTIKNPTEQYLQGLSPSFLFLYVEGRKKAKPTVKKTPTNALNFLKV